MRAQGLSPRPLNLRSLACMELHAWKHMHASAQSIPLSLTRVSRHRAGLHPQVDGRERQHLGQHQPATEELGESETPFPVALRGQPTGESVGERCGQL